MTKTSAHKHKKPSRPPPTVDDPLAAIEQRKTGRLEVVDVGLLGRVYTTPWVHRLVPTRPAVWLARLAGLARWWTSATERQTSLASAADLLAAPIDSAGVRRIARRGVAHRFASRELLLRPWSERRIRVEGRNNLEVARGQGRGVILMGGHIGFTGTRALDLSGYRVYCVAGRKVARGAVLRGMEGRLAALLYERAEQGKNRLVPTELGAYWALKSLLERGEICWIAFDLPGKVQTTFLGRQVRLAGGTVALARATGAPIVPMFGLIYGSRRCVHLLEPVDPARFRSSTELQEHLARILSGVVLEHPEQLSIRYRVSERER